MAKLDEIAELLTEEIHSFEKTVDKLEAIQYKLKDYKLEPDTSLVNQLLRDYHSRQKLRIDELRKLGADTHRIVEKSQIIPRWQVKLFWAWSFFNLLGWGITVVLLLKS